MKTLWYIPLICIAALAACGPKAAKTVATEQKNPCTDTAVKVIFINTRKVELNVHILIQHSERQGNTIINSWTKYKEIPLKPGDDNTQMLPVSHKFMYDVYGPVSTNVTGVGIVATKKMTLIPCQILTEEF